MQKNICEEITELVDGEISDSNRADELIQIINNNKDLAFEKFVQSSIKKIIKERYYYHKTPRYISDLIKKRLLDSQIISE